MAQALVVYNPSSGGYSARVTKHLERLTATYDATWTEIDDAPRHLSAHAYDLLVVAGGDGTLHSVLNMLGGRDTAMIYVPCGTLNERAGSLRRRERDEYPLHVGCYTDAAGHVGVISYVAAAGSFTPIGYIAHTEQKRRVGRLAYLSTVLGEYRVRPHDVSLTVDGKEYADRYTLIMVIQSDRCFGFHFNHIYDPDALQGQLLLIKAPKYTDFRGKFSMFFPFFRAFFLGFRGEYHSKTITFLPFREVTMHLGDAPIDFDIDGEKVPLSGDIDLSFRRYDASFRVRAMARRTPRQTKDHR